MKISLWLRSNNSPIYRNLYSWAIRSITSTAALYTIDHDLILSRLSSFLTSLALLYSGSACLPAPSLSKPLATVYNPNILLWRSSRLHLLFILYSTPLSLTIKSSSVGDHHHYSENTTHRILLFKLYLSHFLSIFLVLW